MRVHGIHSVHCWVAIVICIEALHLLLPLLLLLLLAALVRMAAVKAVAWQTSSSSSSSSGKRASTGYVLRMILEAELAVHTGNRFYNMLQSVCLLNACAIVYKLVTLTCDSFVEAQLYAMLMLRAVPSLLSVEQYRFCPLSC
jgi:hypothetical protein